MADHRHPPELASRSRSTLMSRRGLLTASTLLASTAAVAAALPAAATAQVRAVNFTPLQRIPGTPGADAEPPQIARSGNNVFILWHEFPDNFDPANPQPDVFLARSTDKGNTFKPRINLSNSPTEFSGAEDIAVSGTRVYVVWVEGGEIAFRRDRENDGVFSNKITLNDVALGSVNNPQIVASGNNVYVVWETMVGGQTDIFFSRSTNGGDSFKDTRAITTNAGDSLAPQIALLSDNQVLVAWRDDSGLLASDIFYSRGNL
jgi:hypothetical protein